MITISDPDFLREAYFNNRLYVFIFRHKRWKVSNYGSDFDDKVFFSIYIQEENKTIRITFDELFSDYRILFSQNGDGLDVLFININLYKGLKPLPLKEEKKYTRKEIEKMIRNELEKRKDEF